MGRWSEKNSSSSPSPRTHRKETVKEEPHSSSESFKKIKKEADSPSPPRRYAKQGRSQSPHRRDRRRSPERNRSRSPRRDHRMREYLRGRNDRNRNRGDRSRDRHREREEEGAGNKAVREWDRGKRMGRSPVLQKTEEDEKFGLRNKKREETSVAEKKSVIMEGRKEHQKWGTAEMREEEERKQREKETPLEKEKVNLGTSGALTEDTNTFKGVVIKYNEPPDAKKPNIRWRLYPFKGEEALPVLYIHRQSAYLVGRDRKIADLPVDHPSCSKQHAALQFRSVFFEKEDGSRARRIRPYIIDLSSGNGTYLNGVKIDAQRYYELKEKDVIKFGFSTREFVIMTENALENAEREEHKEEDSESESD